ncbi:GNAT family N-acetyltransferase [Candidatus Enterococcus murrayae]|uniref:GNAT family N-acetyltransferase n=1 Tax=Candidatus Enterococcus murrayae TaxID=2815321 RepID=A0ABS3HBH2_9ENTE|nr:GNAT family N-acetyltransferase [Enterococcus sp. MJM16]MBO0450816.1 GNAT family N-acetyltransferase [Enterococcus sp. MJM16]
MLDKSVPFIPFTMFRPSNATSLPEIQLPEGYQIVFYQPGDEKDWCRIETAVLEFDTEKDAADYFKKSFTPFQNELKKRMLFVENPLGEKVATFTAWWTKDDYPRLHWLGVIPEEQRKGLAKALAIRVTQILHENYPDQDLYLNTQTWSHHAVKLYKNLNYQIFQDQNYQKILDILTMAE